ncbi:MAG: multicopper oxidase type 2 [Gemmatimonadetes bacterium]|nr:multicopper oxidase type 2 [Gemmatimonadota bacterium]
MKTNMIAGALAVVCAVTAQGQVVACPAQQDSLINMPVINSSSVDHTLRATLKLVDGVRTMWGPSGDPRCAKQVIRLLQGFDPAHMKPWPSSGEPIPGPTFRARLGDLVEVSFFNQIDLKNFGASLDKGDMGTMSSCDQFTASTSATTSKDGPAQNDGMPNCIHGSSTTNVHWHGTHTTPSTTGDNVLLFIRPALRTNGKLRPADETRAMNAFSSIYKACEAHGPPTRWTQLPTAWQTAQRALVKEYDSSAVYEGKAGTMPDRFRLWPFDSLEIAAGGWPQYQIGANPYCFPLPKYDSTTMRMGQAPGTHWYHAHKHGSTALNVANGLTGVFIVSGDYDDALHAYYGPAFREQVLMMQQLATVPFPSVPLPSTVGIAPISINGRLNPVVAMRPGEIQLWRIVNGAFRDAVDFAYFEPTSPTSCSSATAPRTNVQWRQVAQDGVQFRAATYEAEGTVNHTFNLAPGNRADLLVKAPAATGLYTLCVARNIAVYVQSTGGPQPPSALLTVSVGGADMSPVQDFIPAERFPVQPSFLADIHPDSIRFKRELVFGPAFNMIDGKVFVDHHFDQAMLLNTAEEWTVKNTASDIAHPFHIHINPFQIFELFEPNSPAAKTRGNPCYVDPDNPATFKPCAAGQPHAPYIWWDVFAIPTGQQIDVTARCVPAGGGAPLLQRCPAPLHDYIKCVSGKCMEYIPGYFKMRSRFVDFTGQFVLHCHILVHEDRGMMQLIEVVSDKSGYTHH